MVYRLRAGSNRSGKSFHRGSIFVWLAFRGAKRSEVILYLYIGLGRTEFEKRIQTLLKLLHMLELRTDLLSGAATEEEVRRRNRRLEVWHLVKVS